MTIIPTTFLSRIETPKCFLCGYKGELDVPNHGLFLRNQGAPIQEAFPDLDKGEREQIISGTHPWCWTEMFGSH